MGVFTRHGIPLETIVLIHGNCFPSAILWQHPRFITNKKRLGSLLLFFGSFSIAIQIYLIFNWLRWIIRSTLGIRSGSKLISSWLNARSITAIFTLCIFFIILFICLFKGFTFSSAYLCIKK